MTDDTTSTTDHGWTYTETSRRQLEAGAHMTSAERLRWLEEMLDDLLPLVGRARESASPIEPEDR